MDIQIAKTFMQCLLYANEIDHTSSYERGHGVYATIFHLKVLFIYEGLLLGQNCQQ